MQKNWIVKNNMADQDAKKAWSVHPIVTKLLENRGITTPEEINNFFSFSYDTLSDPSSIEGMKLAVDRIRTAKANNEKVAIFGDYDADGVTATALLYETLEQLGITRLTYYLPDRQLEGYGMNREAINYLHQDGVTLIITVDCGITNVEEAKLIKSLGIDLIVTDHHHVPEKLPLACAILNPHMKNSGFQTENLSGVGVAFKLAQGLYQQMAPEKSDQLKWVLDLVAIGTIADCVSLLGENRVLVKYGLVVLSKTRRPGLQEMFRIGRITIDENNIPDTQRVAFQIAPRINAAGRIDHASMSYKLVIEKDRAKAHNMALEVESKNKERQKVTGEIVREIQVLAKNSFKDKKFIFVENPHWPVGILGLVAGKISNEFSKPTIVLQRQEKEFVGSLRSIPELNIMEVLNQCANLLTRFGGHAQAAGITCPKDNLDSLYEKMTTLIDASLANKVISPSLDIDLEIHAEDIDWKLIEELSRMQPFGEGNEEPVFLIRRLEINDVKVVGNGSKHLKLALRPSSSNPKIFDAIGFGMGERFPDLSAGDLVDIVFTVSEDQWNGNKKIQMKLIDMEMHTPNEQATT